MATPTVHGIIEVVSGRLCFGGLHNIWDGASSPPVHGLPKARLEASGTVRVHWIDYNISAINGTWNAYQLLDLTTNKSPAWFLAHSAVNPTTEVSKILCISGSPSDPDSGSSTNNAQTASAGIFVIKRYDWGYHDNRSMSSITYDTPEGDNDILANANSLGVVDASSAHAMVSLWQTQQPSQREWSRDGAWLYCPGGEYMFGRFGFDEERAAARPFLFFSTNTVFTTTGFAGTTQALRKEESDEERFERRLREGYDFSGIEQMREMATSQEDPSFRSFNPPATPVRECFVPYEPINQALGDGDIHALLMYRDEVAVSGWQVPVREFAEPWAEATHDLINTMILSYLEHQIAPHMGNMDLATAGEVLFPPETRSGPESGDSYYYPSFVKPDAKLIPGFDYVAVNSRIKAFLSRFEDGTVVFQEECIAGITRVLTRIFAEVLDGANLYARACRHSKIVPSDVRFAVYHDEALMHCLRFSRVFWEGRDGLKPRDS